jgi:DNA replication initiation complex subunit (GINS family)
MIGYNELYEILRKERFADSLQPLPRNFLDDFMEYLREWKSEDNNSNENLFSDSVAKNRKQYENSIALFKELILRRKKKLLNLVFTATETGIMKRDYENMLDFEKIIFDNIVKAFEVGDKELNTYIQGSKGKVDNNKMILLLENVDEFLDFKGEVRGPFKKGEFVNLESNVADILIGDNKASVIDS